MDQTEETGKSPLRHITVLAVDDDPLALILVEHAASTDGGVLLTRAATADEALDLLADRRFDLVLLDLGLEDRSGLPLLADVIAASRGGSVALMTGDDRPETIVECMRRGAFDFAAKPVSLSRFLAIFMHVRELAELKHQVKLLSGEDDAQAKNPAFAPIITKSPLMLELFREIKRISRSPHAVLVIGESGVGKELVARAIHELSGREGAFITVNVAGLDDALFSDTLFGHFKGAYTGADAKRKGLVREAERGTLFLDELGDIQPESQAKLLRFLQNGEFYPLGADKPEQSAARIVTATNADLQAKVRAGTFRADLYFRLMIHCVSIPPLRERREDIPLLVEKFSHDAAESLGREAPEQAEGFIAALEDWPFPGNVRELYAIVHGAMVHAENGILPPAYALEYMRTSAGDLARDATGKKTELPATAIPFALTPAVSESEPLPRLDDVIDHYITEALRRSGGNQTIAARMLAISQSTISRHLASMQKA